MHDVKIISTSKIPGNSASSIQVMKMADAFAGMGYKVEIFIPGWHRSMTSGQFKNKYNIKNDFKIHYLPYISIGGKCKAATFSMIVFIKAFAWRKKNLIVTRNERVARLISSLGKKVLYENHTFYYPSNKTTIKYRKRAAKTMSGKNVHMIAISNRLKELWMNYGVNKKNISVVHDGVNIENYRIPKNMNEDGIRKELNLPQNKKIICYIGTLKIERGVDFILEASRLYRDYIFVLVGGSQREINDIKSQFKPLSNVIFTGYIDNEKIPLYLKASDLLVMPYKRSVTTIDGCSPMKVFEYLASGAYILSPRFESFYEVLKDFEGITFYESEDKKRFILEIDKILTGHKAPSFYNRDEKLALYSWSRRAKLFIDIFSKTA